VLRERLDFVAGNASDILTAIPAAPAVFLLRGADPNAEPYVSKTANLRRRLLRLLGPVEERTRRLNLREQVRWIEYTVTGSDFESGFLLYRVLRAYFPATYAKRLRLRPAPLIQLILGNQYPRAAVTTRLGRLNGPSLYYGPFYSRTSAEKFANDALDFFKMRRCVEDLHPDPAFPGCIYSEMKMCLAPCFKGCTDDEYHTEVARVQQFLDSGGESLRHELSARRETASQQLEFETAAALHAQLEKLTPTLSQLPEMVQRIDRLSAVMMQTSSEPGCVALWRVDYGAIAGPAQFSIPPAEHAKSQSMEARVQAALAELPPAKPRSAAETMEHLSLLRRWLYRGSRRGEIFFADGKGALPMRRIVRGIGRVHRGEQPEAAPVPPTHLPIAVAEEKDHEDQT
jgi:excinuclease UvrABC nuclease subunit